MGQKSKLLSSNVSSTDFSYMTGFLLEIKEYVVKVFH